MVLTTLSEAQAPEEARHLLTRSQTEASNPEMSRGMMEMIITIMVYKFTQLSRVEVEQMLGISLQETRVYQEAREEEARSLILRLLHRRVGELPEAIRLQVVALSLPQLEALGEALLDFTGLPDLETWLNQRAGSIESDS
jgi:predicted transposase YdaD